MALAVPVSNATDRDHAGAVARLPGIAIAGAASLGAGVVHAGAIGIHAEHAALARLFIAAAVFQLGWGLIALFRPSRLLAAIGAAGNLGLVVAWLVTRLTGVSFVGGLEVRENAQFTDTATALLGLIAAALAFSALLIGWRSSDRATLLFPGLAVAALTIPAMVAGSNHVHTGTAAHDHAATGATATAADGHVHATDTGAAPTDGQTTTTEHAHAPQALATTPYDPTKPIDLGGVPTVTPEQQAAAENLVAVTLVRLPKWQDLKAVEAAGFQSIGDGLTGTEHYLQWDWINDDIWLDPDHPESLVFEPQPDGSKKLVSAMYMLPDTTALEAVPNIGGDLMQWHIHNNLCFTKDPVAPKVAGITSSNGECPSFLQTFPSAPMIHVWITPNPCGPFAALEGVGAGQIAAGEERLCDHVHGDGL